MLMIKCYLLVIVRDRISPRAELEYRIGFNFKCDIDIVQCQCTQLHINTPRPCPYLSKILM